MTENLTHLIAARDLREQKGLAGARFARVGWGQMPVTAKHKHDDDEMQAVPVPILALGSLNLEGLMQFVRMVQLPEEVGVGLKLQLVNQHKTRFAVLWKLPSRDRYEVFQEGETTAMSEDPSNVEGMTRVFEYAKLSKYLLFDLFNTGNGTGYRTQFVKISANPANKVFSYVRERFPVPCVMNMD